MENVRKARLAQESSSSKRFASGDELKSLREDLESLRHNLEWAKALKDEVRISSLTKAIKNGQNRDPHFMYSKALRLIAEAQRMKDASQEEKDALTEKWSSVANAARQMLPEFGMEGLWVGKFAGKGQVSRRGFKDHRYVEGQMILFENQFSFVWIPTKHHVLFHRPSPEMTLKLLRDTISKEDEIENMRNHLDRCFNMDLSTAIARQHHAIDFDEPLRRIATRDDLKEAEQRIKENNRGNIFYQMSKWRDYIDQVLDSSSKK
ncbi:MAG: hypothetical protein SGARI_005373 [Bacillariaceae sp.]